MKLIQDKLNTEVISPDDIRKQRVIVKKPAFMLDLENVSLADNGCLLEIGLVFFDLADPTTIGDFPMWNRFLSLDDQILSGGSVDPETLAWWRSDRIKAAKAYQDKASRRDYKHQLSWMNMVVRGILDALKGAGHDLNNIYWLARGDSDFRQLNYWFKQAGLSPVCKYNQIQDVRSMIAAYSDSTKGFTVEKHYPDWMAGVIRHTAIGDALMDAFDLAFLRKTVFNDLPTGYTIDLSDDHSPVQTVADETEAYLNQLEEKATERFVKGIFDSNCHTDFIIIAPEVFRTLVDAFTTAVPDIWKEALYELGQTTENGEAFRVYNKEALALPTDKFLEIMKGRSFWFKSMSKHIQSAFPKQYTCTTAEKVAATDFLQYLKDYAVEHDANTWDIDHGVYAKLVSNMRVAIPEIPEQVYFTCAKRIESRAHVSKHFIDESPSVFVISLKKKRDALNDQGLLK